MMFETVVPEIARRKSRKILYELLPVSIVLHVLLVATFVVAAAWHVVFPSESPHLLRPYALVEIPEPPPLPPPPPPPQPKAPPPRVTKPVPAPPPLQLVHLDVAPSIIPDIIPKVDATPPPPPPPVEAPPPPTAVPTLGPSVAGSPNGVVGGKPGGLTIADDGRVHIARNEKLPLKELDHEYPHYPDAARSRRLEGDCVVRFTIGRDGRVHNITVLQHASDAMFDNETIQTVSNWTYRPLTIDGKQVEVVYDLEVSYEYIVR